ncbi:HAD-IC family P-type ATPase [Micrococcus luteus]
MAAELGPVSVQDPTPVQGLSSGQVAERVAAGRTNAQPDDTSRSLLTILRVHVLTLFNLTIGLAAAVIIVLGRWLDLLFCLAAVANVVIGVVQEYSAKRKLEKIALLHQDGVTVVRDGARQSVALADVVLDDVVALRRGDQVPVDAEVLTADGLDLDESLLTGESDPVPKRPGDTVLSGSAVVAGTGLVRATAVGADSHASKLAAQARRFTKISSELRGALEKVASWITVALVPIVALIVHGQVQAFGGWAYALENPREVALEPALVASVAAVTSMIPQGLALMTTISFAVAALKLAREQVLIQEQPAVEILARVDVVCVDKTGTLTEGGIVFHGAEPLDADGADPSARPDDGTVASATPPAAATAPAPLFPAAQAVLGVAGADPDANPTAAALREPFPAVPQVRPVQTVAFSSSRRWSALAFGPGADAEVPGLSGSWLMGAPEALIDVEAVGVRAAEQLSARCADLADAGLRTILLCRTDHPLAGDRLPAGMRPVAVLTFAEDVRSDAAETLGYFREQGVQIRVISGDNPRTVAAVAREVGMELTGHAVDARELPEEPGELADIMDAHEVFGRVGPEQKQAMVKALQSRGHVVAMTGDGVNDALALKSADLGIAMGNAAPATKAVSRLVLLDGKFARLPSVLKEGRQVIANMERLAHIYLTKTTYAALFGVVFSMLFWQFPLLPRQASTVDFLMIGLPTFFLALLSNPRRYVPGFLRRALLFAVPSGTVILLGMVALGAYVRGFAAGPVAEPQQQAAAMVTLTLMGLWVLTVMTRPFTKRAAVLVLSMYALLALVLAVPGSRWYHLLEVPSPDLLVAAVGIAVVGCVLIELIHRVHHARVVRPTLHVASPGTFSG